MRISVVIPALNEAGNIGRLVQDTFAQVPPDCLAEVIVVDDASEDVTGAEVKALIASGGCPGCATCATGSAAARAPHCARASLRRRARSSRRWMATARTTRATSRGCWQGLPLRAAAGRRSSTAGARRAARRAASASPRRRRTGSATPCSRTTAPIPAAASRCTGARRSCACRTSRRCTATCRRCSTYGHEVARAGQRPATPGRRLEIQQRRPRAGRLYDLVGVSWLRRRTRVPAIVEDLRGPAAGGPHQPLRPRSGRDPAMSAGDQR